MKMYWGLRELALEQAGRRRDSHQVICSEGQEEKASHSMPEERGSWALKDA